MGCTVSTAISTVDVKKTTEDKLPTVQVEEDGTSSNSVKFDPRLPLTVRQKFNISKSWKAIGRNMEVTGINMFIRLFETNDMVKVLFKKLQGYNNTAELRESAFLENHVKMVMYTLDEAIASLDDVDFVVDMLLTVGKTHRRLEGFYPEIFWEIEEPFLLAVKETLQDRYTANMEHIYQKVIRFILETLISGFNNGLTPATEPVITICEPN